jgi:hypothetical protein
MSALVTVAEGAPLWINAGRLRGCELLDRAVPRSCHLHQSLRRVARKICVLRDALEVGMDRVAKLGERDRGFAFKKRAAQLLFEPDDGVGQRRLGDTAASSCSRETALLAEREKIANSVHFHGPPRRIDWASCTRLPSMLAWECEVVHISTIFLAYFPPAHARADRICG